MTDTENVLDGGRIVINGGDPIKDCPTDYDWAHRWAENANGSGEEWERPLWRWDCGFKLDYDGPIVRFSSRFYPTKTHYGDKWDGDLTIFVLTKEVQRKRFSCETLEELRSQVESFATTFSARMVAVLSTLDQQ